MILDLHRQGVGISAIARRTGLDRKTVRKVIAGGLEPAVYGPRPARATTLRPFEAYLRERLAAVPELTGRRLHREIRERGYCGGYTAVTDLLREVGPVAPPGFEVRFETPAGEQAQVDFAHFQTAFADEPEVTRTVWLFSLVLGHSRMMWGRFVLRQDMQTLLRCHIAAFEALGGVPAEILYDRMRTVFHREDTEGGHIVYNATLLGFARHYGYLPKACRPYRAKTKGIRRHLVSLRMPRALETLDQLVQQIERGQLGSLEAIEALLAEELTIRAGRRIKAALQMARLTPVKTLASFDFAFQPSLDRNRILALAGLDFIDRHEVVHLIGQSGTGKSHLAIALGVEAVRAGRSVYFAPLADIIDSLARAEREGRLRERIRYLCRAQLLIIDA